MFRSTVDFSPKLRGKNQHRFEFAATRAHKLSESFIEPASLNCNTKTVHFTHLLMRKKSLRTVAHTKTSRYSARLI